MIDRQNKWFVDFFKEIKCLFEERKKKSDKENKKIMQYIFKSLNGKVKYFL